MTMQVALFRAEHIASPATMQAKYSQEMDGWRPYRLYRKLRLEALLAEAGGPKALMDLTGVTDTHLTACSKGRRAVGDDMAASLEEGMGKPFGWMDTSPEADTRDEASLTPWARHIAADAMTLSPERRRQLRRILNALLSDEPEPGDDVDHDQHRAAPALPGFGPSTKRLPET